MYIDTEISVQTFVWLSMWVSLSFYLLVLGMEHRQGSVYERLMFFSVSMYLSV